MRSRPREAAFDAVRRSVSWSVYVVRCGDGTLYTGIARDVERRIVEHNGDDRLGARYTRSRRPVTLVYREAFTNRSEASKREAAIKRMTRGEKEQLVGGSQDMSFAYADHV